MLKELMTQKQEIEARIAMLSDQKKEVDRKIDAAVCERLQAARDLSGKDLGTINIVVDGVEVKQTIPKKVVWDQKLLGEVLKRIQASGDEPQNYMKLKFSVTEKDYNGFIPEIQSVFSPARTVQPGTPKVDLKIKEAA